MDKGIITAIVGSVVGLLVMKGYIEPNNADTLTQSVTVFIGAALALGTVIAGLHHSRETQKIDQTKTTQTTVTTTEQQPVEPVTPSV